MRWDLASHSRRFLAHYLTNRKRRQIDQILTGQPVALPEPTPTTETKPAAVVKPAARDSAITLLASLQREARLVDLVQEDLSQFSDAQVGAAARPCLQECANVLGRLFALEPVVPAAEGEAVPVSSEASPLRFQWVGEGTGETGKLIHHGWQTTKVELPKWTGDTADANIVAPAQIQAS